MYDLFCDDRFRKSNDEDYVEPVKRSFYNFIFNTELNRGFHVRKTDRCDLCEAYAHDMNPSEDDRAAYAHAYGKHKTKEEREADRDIEASTHMLYYLLICRMLVVYPGQISLVFSTSVS